MKTVTRKASVSGRSRRLRVKFTLWGAVALMTAFLITGAPVLPAASIDEGETLVGNDAKEHAYHVQKKVGGLELFVGTQLMQMKSDADLPEFTPLLFALQNLKHRGVTVHRDRIKLYDRYGTEVPMATLNELRKEYGRQRYDRQVLQVTNFGGQLERTTRLVGTNFFPVPGEVGVYKIQVPRWGKMLDLLYFKGVLTEGEKYKLVIDVEEEAPELALEFTIPAA